MARPGPIRGELVERIELEQGGLAGIASVAGRWPPGVAWFRSQEGLPDRAGSSVSHSPELPSPGPLP